MKSLADRWEAYSTHVMHADAPRAQVAEARKAFYSGAASALAMLDISLGETCRVPTIDAITMEKIRAELIEFRRGFVRGLKEQP